MLVAVQAFDITTGKWTRRANMTYPRGDFASEVLSNGNILTAGGHLQQGERSITGCMCCLMQAHNPVVVAFAAGFRWRGQLQGWQ